MMIRLLKWLFCIKPISLEVRYLLDAINSDEVEFIGEYYELDVVRYNGQTICAYTVNSASGYEVDIGELEGCLPRHEAKAVYFALSAFSYRRKRNLRRRINAVTASEVKKKLGQFHVEN